jgi:hypothetical protein
MFDPFVAEALRRNINILWRQRSQPHGTIDHFYRGTRMTYNFAYRTLVCLSTLGAVSLAAAAFLFLPGILHDKDGMALCAKIIATGMAIIGIFVSLQALCEFVVVNDDGLLKSGFLGRKKQMAWNEVLQFQVKIDDNKVILRGEGKLKLTMNLAYDGWQDFLEMAGRRLNLDIYTTIAITLAHVDAKKAATVSPFKSLWKKRAVTKRPS